MDVRQFVQRYLQLEALPDYDDSLEALGADSLDLWDMAIAIEERTGGYCMGGWLSSIATVGDLQKMADKMARKDGGADAGRS